METLDSSDRLTIVSGTAGNFMDNKTFSSDQGLIDFICRKASQKQTAKYLKTAFNDTGDSFVTADNLGNIQIFHVDKRRYVTIAKSKYPSVMAYTDRAGGQVILAQPSKDVEVFTETGKLKSNLRGHKNVVHTISFSHAGNQVLTCSSDACMIWDSNSYRLLKSLTSKGSPFTSAVFTPDGASIVTAFQDGAVIFWRLSDCSVEDKLTLPKEANIKFMGVSKDSHYLVAAGDSTLLYVINLRQSRNFTSYSVPGGEPIVGLSMTSKDCVSVVSYNGKVYIADLNSMGVVVKKEVPNKAIISASTDTSGKFLTTVVNTGEIYLYDLPKLAQSEQKSTTGRSGLSVTSDLAQSTLKPVKHFTRQSVTSASGRQSEPRSPGKRDSSEEEPAFNKENLRKIANANTMSITTKGRQSTTASLKSDTHTMEKQSTGGKGAKLSVESLSKPKLKQLLARHHVYPDKYREMAWKFLLETPNNVEQFKELSSKGIHSAFKHLNETHELRNHQLFSKLQAICSALAFYCPLFGEVEHLPELVFPFVKLFASDDLFCFEVVLSFFFHWGQHFFEYFPNPPVALLQDCEELLRFHDLDLYNHLKNKDISMINYLWPFYRTIFTEILSRDAWVELFDFLVTHRDEPHLIVFFSVAYLKYFRTALLRIETKEAMKTFVSTQNPVNIQNVIKLAASLKKITPGTAHNIMYTTLLPLEKGQYQVFKMYPKYAAEQHRRVREQMYTERLRFEEREKQTGELQVLTTELLKQERLFKEKQDALLAAENERREFERQEEDRKLRKKINSENQSRETRLLQLRLLQESLKDSLVTQHKVRDTEFREMEREYETRKRIEDFAFRSRMEEAALAHLEVTTANQLNEIIALRNREEQARRIRMELDRRAREQHAQDRAFDDAIRAEDSEFRLKQDLIRQQKLFDYAQRKEENDRKEFENRLAVEDFEREMKFRDVERERRKRRLVEGHMIDTEEETRKMKEEFEKLKAQEQELRKTYVEAEKANALRRTQKELEAVEEEQKVQMRELEEYKERIRGMTEEQRKLEFQMQVRDLKYEYEMKLLEEEKKIQAMMLETQKARMEQQTLEDELYNKQRSFKEKVDFHRSIKVEHDRVIDEERRKFFEFKAELDAELKQTEENQQKEVEKRVNELTYQREELLEKKLEEMRNKIQTENMISYIDSELRRNETMIKGGTYAGGSSMKKDHSYSRAGGDERSMAMSQNRSDRSPGGYQPSGQRTISAPLSDYTQSEGRQGLKSSQRTGRADGLREDEGLQSGNNERTFGLRNQSNLGSPDFSLSQTRSPDLRNLRGSPTLTYSSLEGSTRRDF